MWKSRLYTINNRVAAQHEGLERTTRLLIVRGGDPDDFAVRTPPAPASTAEVPASGRFRRQWASPDPSGPCDAGTSKNRITARSTSSLGIFRPCPLRQPGSPPRLEVNIDTFGMHMENQIEGWIDDDYVRIYAADNRQKIASLYEFNTYLPGFILYGSYGLDAICQGVDKKIYLIPWIPLDKEHGKERYPNLESFEKDIERIHKATKDYIHFEKEIHFVHPIIFGGSPTEQANIKMIDQNAHAEICRYWNKVYLRMKKK